MLRQDCVGKIDKIALGHAVAKHGNVGGIANQESHQSTSHNMRKRSLETIIFMFIYFPSWLITMTTNAITSHHHDTVQSTKSAVRGWSAPKLKNLGEAFRAYLFEYQRSVKILTYSCNLHCPSSCLLKEKYSLIVTF